MPDETKGMSRRRALECGLWAGAGVLWTVSGGVPRASLLGSAHAATEADTSLSFVQISDSHIGFNKAANPEATQTFKALLDRVAAMKDRPDFMLHTGDVSHLSRDSEWDTAQLLVKATGIETHFIPGEHDMLVDNGAPFFARFAPDAAKPGGWYSFDAKGVHFVALVNVAALKPGGEGSLGAAQLAWLENDLKDRAASQPIVVTIHIPLWQVYPQWGWGTEDGAQALTYLRRFGSVTVLNGHIHQLLQKVEGNVAFHTGMSTAFPQPAPGAAASPGPMTVEPGRLRQLLGVSSVTYVPGKERLAIVDRPLGA